MRKKIPSCSNSALIMLRDMKKKLKSLFDQGLRNCTLEWMLNLNFKYWTDFTAFTKKRISNFEFSRIFQICLKWSGKVDLFGKTISDRDQLLCQQFWIWFGQGRACHQHLPMMNLPMTSLMKTLSLWLWTPCLLTWNQESPLVPWNLLWPPGNIQVILYEIAR